MDKGSDDYSAISRVYLTKAQVTPGKCAPFFLPLSFSLSLSSSLSVKRWSSCTQHYGLVELVLGEWRNFRDGDGRLHNKSARILTRG